jgi:hypothetical protein
MVQCAAAALGFTPLYLHPRRIREQPELLAEAVSMADILFIFRREIPEVRELARSCARPDLPIVAAPRLHFPGFHPDVTTPRKAAGKLLLPMGNLNSAILLAAFRDGLSVAQALSLFRDEVYDALGYYDAFGLATEALEAECRHAGIDVQPLMPEWMAGGPFFYVPLHPKIVVLRDLALAQLRSAGMLEGESNSPVDDELSRNLVWPVYPEIASRLGMTGDYIFRPRNRPGREDPGTAPMDLETFAERTFAAYERSPPDYSEFPRMSDPRFKGIRRYLKNKKAAKPKLNPYADLPASHWWSKSVAEPPVEEVDPVHEAKFTIGRKDKIATAGSCFAQHLARRLEQAGFNYFITERPPPRCHDPAAEDYGTFTARFGNIYTVRQLLQLAGRAFGDFQPAIDAWKLADGTGYLDPFRPKVGAKPYATLKELRADREVHFAAVRQMFETAEIFVFTLGLTECWWSRDDHAVVPLPPGVVGARLPADAYEHKNFTVAEVLSDLQLLLDIFQRVNPTIKILLTVSPVPLIATFEKEHVLSATTYSKSVLRAAAGEIARNNAHVAYFPSFEIISGSFNRGRYFADDLREVTSEGVDHVMNCFLRHFAAAAVQAASTASDWFNAESAAAMNIVCDEEELDGGASKRPGSAAETELLPLNLSAPD